MCTDSNDVFVWAFRRKRPSWNFGFLFVFRLVANRSQVVHAHARSYAHGYNGTWPFVMAEEAGEDPAAVSKNKYYV